jgi:serine/threonine protein kinase
MMIYDSDSKDVTEVSKLFMHEVQMYEVIKKSSTFEQREILWLGCRQGWLDFRIVLAAIPKTLDQVVDDGDSFDHEACLSDIKAGIGHLHRLGIIYCDINPTNVFLNEPTFVIGDFDSSAFEGDKLGLKADTES